MQHRVILAGVRVLVRSTSADGWEKILEGLPEGRTFPPEGPPTVVYSVTPAGAPHLLEPLNQHILYRGARRLLREKDPHAIWHALPGDLTAVVAHRAPRWSLIHAGAVAIGNAGIVLPGSAGSGKTTLVAALLRLGGVYYSDEVASLDRAGKLHPFVKPLWLAQGEEAKTLISAERLGARGGRRACPVRLIAFPEWRSRSRLHMEPLTGAAAALGLFSNAFAAQRHPERILAHAQAAAENAICVQIRYSDAERAAEALLSLLEKAGVSDVR
jgi:hypothetical protein